MTPPYRRPRQPTRRKPRSPEPNDRWLDRLSGALGATSAILAVVGGLLYLVLHWACNVVYSPLGLEPGDVGLDYANLLAQSAVGVAALTIIAMLAGLATVIFRMAMAKPALERYRPGLIVVVGVVAIVFFLDLFLPVPVLDRPLFSVAGAVAAIAALAGVAYVLLVSADARRQALQRGPALAPAVTAVVVFTFLLGLGGNALSGRRDLQEGRRPSTLFVGSPAPWRAETGRVTWTAATDSIEIRFPDCLLYLGEAGGTVVFYDARHGAQEALRVRADDIAIAITHQRTRCPP